LGGASVSVFDWELTNSAAEALRARDLELGRKEEALPRIAGTSTKRRASIVPELGDDLRSMSAHVKQGSRQLDPKWIRACVLASALTGEQSESPTDTKKG
jgi:hypothetical protein